MVTNIYCNNIFEYSRFLTKEVFIGNVALGANNPIRIQSMTNTDTLDTQATVKQIKDLTELGCEYVRITVPSMKEAENFHNIKKNLKKLDINVPLIADVHFNYKVAEYCAQYFEKVRINPGNYSDKKNFKQLEYSESEYNQEIEKIYNRIKPLIKICKENGTALRIGSNHGSLSDRILSRYGDTPKGMVESAMEFINICRDLDFHNIVLSMKASNTRIMIAAYRLLVNQMILNNMNYPIHLGVTEAGNGADARIKSAIGIGALLEDGIGDTIRVSLTESPLAEIPVAEKIVKKYNNLIQKSIKPHFINIQFNPFEYNRRKSNKIIDRVGGNQPQIVISNFKNDTLQNSDFIFINDISTLTETDKNYIIKYENYKTLNNLYPFFDKNNFTNIQDCAAKIKFIEISDLDIEIANQFKNNESIVLVLDITSISLGEIRKFIFKLINDNYLFPIIIKKRYLYDSIEEIQLKSAADFSCLLIDGLIDGIWIESDNNEITYISETSFSILQGSRCRVTKTEYISCPTCGRTQYNIEETLTKIKQKTSHLNHIKIGVMGCIVNGPGEMADADYGYVGAGKGKINLYKQKDVYKKNISEENAVEELINLIKASGDWKEPN